MFILYLIAGTLLSVFAVFSGAGKLLRLPRIVADLHTTVQVPLQWFPLLATLEFMGAAGVVLGAFIAPLGIAAAGGLVLYFLGAIAAHLRLGDVKGVTSPLLPEIVALVTLVARVASR